MYNILEVHNWRTTATIQLLPVLNVPSADSTWEMSAKQVIIWIVIVSIPLLAFNWNQQHLTMTSKEESTNKSSDDGKPSGDDAGIFSGKVVAILMLVYIFIIVLGGLAFHFMEAPQEKTDFSGSVAKLVRFLGEYFSSSRQITTCSNVWLLPSTYTYYNFNIDEIENSQTTLRFRFTDINLNKAINPSNPYTSPLSKNSEMVAWNT